MLIRIPDLLGAEQLAECRSALAAAEWVDGRTSAGYLSAAVKQNRQIPEGHPTARRLGDMIMTALERNPLFLAAALPAKVVPPLFNRYEGGEAYGSHVDGAIRPITGTAHRVRTDLSATLFLSPPEAYEGGELVIEESGGAQSVKLPAGHMVLYPALYAHHIRPVTRGVRLASFFWVQSMVREQSRRTLLFELDGTIQELARAGSERAPVLRLMNIYHNLLREWAEG